MLSKPLNGKHDISRVLIDICICSVIHTVENGAPYAVRPYIL